MESRELWKSREFWKLPRVKAYSIAGYQYCAAGVGEGPSFGSFPGKWTAKEALACTWVQILRTPSDGEKPVRDEHYKLTDFVPTTLLLNPSGVHLGLTEDVTCLGFHGTTSITALNTPVTIAEAYVPRADVDGIETPPTPNPLEVDPFDRC